MTVTIKAFVESDGSAQSEIRRLVLEDAEAHSMEILRKKIGTILDKTLGNDYNIFWKDDDGDDIIVSSDEELKEALSTIKNSIFTIYVRKSNAAHKPQSNKGPNPGDLHPFVVCDGCNCNIRGFRYNCTQCLDFDLCSNCESQGQHSHHVMIRLPTSSSHPASNFWHDFLRASQQSNCSSCPTPGESSQSVPSDTKKQNQTDQPTSVNDIIASLFTTLSEPHTCAQEKVEETGSEKENATESPCQPQGVNGLSDICSVLQSMLGVTCTHSDGQTQGASCTQETGSTTDQTDPLRHLREKLATMWTELGRDTTNCRHHNQGAATHNNPRPTSESANRNSDVLPQEFLQLIQQGVATFLGTPSANSQRSQIDNATNLMMAMGFKNEQGWVTRLLELTDGNVNQVLDLINTVQQSAGGDMESVPQTVISILEAHAANPQEVLNVLRSMSSSRNVNYERATMSAK